MAGRALADLFAASAEAIVDQHLQPALAAVVSEAGEQATELNGATSIDALFRHGDEAGRRAWFALEEAFNRYG